jgi:cyanobactin maturation PatA/PatG family protease
LPCDAELSEVTQRCLAGKLNISGAFKQLQGETMTENLAEASLSENGVAASGCGCGGGLTDSVDTGSIASALADVASSEVAAVTSQTVQPSIQPAQTSTMSNQSSNFVTASQAPSQLAELGQLVYALGTLGYDFGTEARRDSFKQLMPANEIAGTMVPANPYDARQMVDHLESNLAEARSLIWTLNIELTPVYAIEPKGPFAREIYQVLQQLLSGQIQPEDSEDYVERVSIPGVLTGKTVKLFSGQVVPLIEPQNTRGLYGWKVNTLVNAAMQVVTDENEADEDTMRRTLGSFLNRVYYDLRNLGTTSQDRALNFSVTNAFQAASTFGQAVAEGMELDSVTVEKSPFCRMDSDCWDVKLKFFDPENNRRAKKIYRFTIDVSDLIPVTLGEVRSWSSPF